MQEILLKILPFPTAGGHHLLHKMICDYAATPTCMVDKNRNFILKIPDGYSIKRNGTLIKDKILKFPVCGLRSYENLFTFGTKLTNVGYKDTMFGPTLFISNYEIFPFDRTLNKKISSLYYEYDSRLDELMSITYDELKKGMIFNENKYYHPKVNKLNKKVNKINRRINRRK